MLISKKNIHYARALFKVINLKITTLPVYFIYAYVNQKHLINADYSVLNHSNFTILPLFFEIQYTLNFIIRTKHLFIFTIYTIYSKVLTSTNLFCYKFQFLKKNKKNFLYCARLVTTKIQKNN